MLSTKKSPPPTKLALGVIPYWLLEGLLGTSRARLEAFEWLGKPNKLR